MALEETRKIGFITLAAISAADCAAHSMNSLGPFAVGELIKSGQLTTAQAGLWSSVEMLSYAAAMTGIASHVHRVRLRSLALIAACCVIAAQAGSAYVHVLWGLLGLRILSGCGLGAEQDRYELLRGLDGWRAGCMAVAILCQFLPLYSRSHRFHLIIIL